MYAKDHSKKNDASVETESKPLTVADIAHKNALCAESYGRFYAASKQYELEAQSWLSDGDCEKAAWAYVREARCLIKSGVPNKAILPLDLAYDNFIAAGDSTDAEAIKKLQNSSSTLQLLRTATFCATSETQDCETDSKRNTDDSEQQ